VKKRSPATNDRPDAIKARALRLLAARPRSIVELRLRLRQRASDPTQVESVIEAMKRLGFLDDRSFALSRAQSLLASGRLGPRGAVARLLSKGVDRVTAEKAVGEALGDSTEESLAIRALAGRRYGPGATEKENARAARFLASRGFLGSTIGRVLALRDEVDFSES